MATPVGLVPVPGLETTVAVFKLMIEAVPLPLLATTAYERRGITSMPAGEVPTAMVVLRGVAAPGVKSMRETLLQPLLLTNARLRVVSRATAPGCGVVPPPQAGVRSTDSTTLKSVALEPTPPTK